MTTTPPETPTGPPGPQGPPPGPRASRDEMKDLGRLRRSASDRKVAGVAGGIARHLDIDPLVLRVVFVVLAFFGGAGLIVYGACWLLVPDEESGEAPVTLDDRSRTIALLVVGALAAFALIGDSWGYFWFPWPLAIIALVVFIVLNRKDRAARPAPQAGWTPPAYAAAPGATDPATDPAASGPGASGPGDATYTYTAPDYSYTYSRPAYAQPAYTPARDSKRRGPKLFWFTLALIALGIGLLGTADVAGVPVADSAYPALAVGIIGAMLLVGAYFGRAGGLILLGLVAAVGLAGSTAADNFESDSSRITPTESSLLQDTYDFGAGELTLDLTEITDIEDLDGRTLTLDGGFGSIEVIVPDDLTVEAYAHIGGPGDIRLFGVAEGEGFDFSRNTLREGPPGAPTLTIDADLGFGEIAVTTESE